MSNPNYRSYIKGVVFEANKYKTTYMNSLCYNEICKYLKENDIKLEKQMFRAVLCTCNQLKVMIEDGSELPSLAVKDMSELFSMFFHTYTAEDGIHTDSKILEGYVKKIFPIIKQRIDEESQLGCFDLRLKKVDVVRLGKLFDEILKNTGTDNKDYVELLMNNFVLNDLM